MDKNYFHKLCSRVYGAVVMSCGEALRSFPAGRLLAALFRSHFTKISKNVRMYFIYLVQKRDFRFFFLDPLELESDELPLPKSIRCSVFCNSKHFQFPEFLVVLELFKF